VCECARASSVTPLQNKLIEMRKDLIKKKPKCKESMDRLIDATSTHDTMDTTNASKVRCDLYVRANVCCVHTCMCGFVRGECVRPFRWNEAAGLNEWYPAAPLASAFLKTKLTPLCR
jgi:hypothetical protein